MRAFGKHAGDGEPVIYWSADWCKVGVEREAFSEIPSESDIRKE